MPRAPEGHRAADRDPELAALVDMVSTRHAAPAASPPAPAEAQAAPPGAAPACVPISIACMVSSSCFIASVPVANIAAFLNDLGRTTTEARFHDVQFWVQRRTRRKQEDAELWGLVLDVDQVANDPFAALSEAGLPTPNGWWRTRHGYKAVWAFNRAADLATFEGIAQQYALSVEGGDPQSWSPIQAQHLPIVKKTTNDGVVDVAFPAAQSNASPLVIDEFQFELPARVGRALSDERLLTTAERELVEDWLADLGIPVPDASGQRALYQSCPATEQHNKACCYVSRRENGAINVSCLGGHGGEGRKHWSESDLYALVTGSSRSTGRLHSVRDVPPTWAGFEYLRTRLGALFASEKQRDDLVAFAVKVWMRAKAAAELQHAVKRAKALGGMITEQPDFEQVVRFFEQRRHGYDGMSPCRPYFDEVTRDLRLLLDNGEGLQLKIHGESLSLKTHQHEWMASCAYGLSVSTSKNKKTGDISVAIKKTFKSEAQSDWNKALVGHSGHLASLGLPRLTVHELPVAFVRDSCDVEPVTKCIRMVRTARLKPADSTFDTMEFFRRLYREGRLPLGSEDDVPRVVMAIASSLVRLTAPGLLGIYWFTGPSGTGKDFLADLVADIHGTSVVRQVSAKFDLDLAGDMEQKRSFASTEGATYARAKEAGKRSEMIRKLIELPGSTTVKARAMYQKEYEIPNIFTFLADSVEDLPERREISRRTVMINVAAADENTSFGRLRAEVLARAPSIIANLLEIVESKPPEWYQNQERTDSRHVVPVALSRLFGATLPIVAGANTEDLFEAMLVFRERAAEEGQGQWSRASQSAGREAGHLPSYRVSYFIDTMAREPGYQQLFRQFATVRSIQIFLDREARYAEVKRGRVPYLPVDLDGKRYAFKLVRDGRNFVLLEEDRYCAALGINPVGKHEPTTQAAPCEPKSAEGPMRFSAENLPAPNQPETETERAPKSR